MNFTIRTSCLCLVAMLSLTAVRPAPAQVRTQTPGVNTRGTGGAALSSTSQRQSYSSPGMVGEALVTSDPETRRLIIITDDETSQYISQVITNLDRPKPQVLIKVVFLEVTHRNNTDIGIEGSFTRDMVLLNQDFGMAAQGTAPVPPGAGLYQVLGSDFTATLRAIAEAGKTEVLSRPSILARNNQQAVITVGSELPFITNTRITDTGQTINTIQYQDVGIILRVTPFITTDGMVEMIVSPEISTLTDQTVPISTGVSAPVIAKRAADTVVVTPDRQTVIIGGLMENKATTSDSKIPVLGDIPILGNLFKRRAQEKVKTELIIFLTPQIVQEPSLTARLSESESRNQELAPKAFTEEQLDRFLDRVPHRNGATKETTPQGTPAKSGKPRHGGIK